MRLTVQSSSFADGKPIPPAYTCDGRDVSPALAWHGQPASTRSFAVICDDPDAPSGTFTHWVLYDVPSDLTAVAEGAHGIGKEGVNSFRKTGYSGPCPPAGRPHRYFFRVHALDVASIGAAGLSRDAVLAAIQGHVVAEGRIVGLYGRRKEA